LTVVDSEEISDNATPNLGEVLVNQTFNYGSDFQTNTYAARSQVGTTTAANLRGLGERATLNLLDGKRGVGTNLNSTLPQIAIDRIDILKDGASAT
jgi:outer membrane receptor for ferrienterochelin and colicin